MSSNSQEQPLPASGSSYLTSTTSSLPYTPPKTYTNDYSLLCPTGKRSHVRVDIPDPRPRSSTSSTMPDSPNTKAIMHRLLSAPDYHGIGNDEESDSESSIRFASIKKSDDGDSANPARGQRGTSKIKRLLGDELRAGESAVRRVSSEAKGKQRMEEHTQFSRPSFTSLHSMCPPPRVHALEALQPKHSSVKRSQSASAVSAVPPARPTRSPTSTSSPVVSSRLKPGIQGNSLPPSPNTSFPSPEVSGPEPPLMTVRSSSVGESATKKANRRRSALLWVKEHAGFKISKPNLDSPAKLRSKPSFPSKSETSRNGSLLSSSSNESPTVPQLPSATYAYSPLASSFERFGIMVNKSDESRETPLHGHGSEGDSVSPYYTVVGSRTPLHGHGSPESREDVSVSPYYTVVGSSSTDVVPADSAEEHNEDSVVLSQRTTISAGPAKLQRPPKHGFNLGLGRSASSKKHKPSEEGEEKEPKRWRNRLRGKSVHIQLRPSTTENPKPQDNDRDMRTRKRRSYSLSMDQFPFEGSPQSLSRSPSTDRKGSTRSLWKLVKRMGSNGALGDRYNDGIPPVPSLPLSAQSSTTSPVSEVNGNEVLARLLSSSQTGSADNLDSLSPSKPTTPSKASSSSRLKYPTAPFADGLGHPTSRAISNTRSSTPASPDHPSSKLPQRSYSAQSSTSSLPEPSATPPLPHPPSALLGHRGMASTSTTTSPVDYGHLSDSGYRSFGTNATAAQRGGGTGHPTRRAAMEDDWAPRESPTLEFPSLPTPPRRHKTSLVSAPAPPALVDPVEDGLFKPDPADLEDLEELSVIPEFSVENPINAFAVRNHPAKTSAVSKEEQPSAAETEAVSLPPVIPIASASSLPPPPRPARNARRPQAPIIVPKDHNSDNGESNPSSAHDGYGAQPLTSTFGPSPMFTLTDPHHPVPPLPSGLQQDLDTPPPLPTAAEVSASSGKKPRTLTEEEKATKWDSLLERSAMAGGTLHLKIGVDSVLEAGRTLYSASQ